MTGPGLHAYFIPKCYLLSVSIRSPDNGGFTWAFNFSRISIELLYLHFYTYNFIRMSIDCTVVHCNDSGWKGLSHINISLELR